LGHRVVACHCHCSPLHRGIPHSTHRSNCAHATCGRVILQSGISCSQRRVRRPACPRRSYHVRQHGDRTSCPSARVIRRSSSRYPPGIPMESSQDGSRWCSAWSGCRVYSNLSEHARCTYPALATEPLTLTCARLLFSTGLQTLRTRLWNAWCLQISTRERHKMRNPKSREIRSS
jgi:hypothetical protein